jgi:hypothetical protein
LLLSVLILSVCPNLYADSSLVAGGSGTDAATSAPVVGAEIVLQRGDAVLGRGISDKAGKFLIPFNVNVRRETQYFTLIVRHSKYSLASANVEVVSGASIPEYPFQLLPESLIDCMHNQQHAIVVGYFASPGLDKVSLTRRIATTLEYDLLTLIQQQRLSPKVQPFVHKCPTADPQATKDYMNFAKALRADAFLTGYIAPLTRPSDTKVKVEMIIADRFGLLEPYTKATSPDVNLGDPAGARLASEAYAAILTALIAGYEQEKMHEACFELTVVAQKLLPTLPPKIAEARQRCQDALPTKGLLPEDAL